MTTRGSVFRCRQGVSFQVPLTLTTPVAFEVLPLRDERDAGRRPRRGPRLRPESAEAPSGPPTADALSTGRGGGHPCVGDGLPESSQRAPGSGCSDVRRPGVPGSGRPGVRASGISRYRPSSRLARRTVESGQDGDPRRSSSATRPVGSLKVIKALTHLDHALRAGSRRSRLTSAEDVAARIG